MNSTCHPGQCVGRALAHADSSDGGRRHGLKPILLPRSAQPSERKPVCNRSSLDSRLRGNDKGGSSIWRSRESAEASDGC